MGDRGTLCCTMVTIKGRGIGVTRRGKLKSKEEGNEMKVRLKIKGRNSWDVSWRREMRSIG